MPPFQRQGTIISDDEHPCRKLWLQACQSSVSSLRSATWRPGPGMHQNEEESSFGDLSPSGSLQCWYVALLLFITRAF